MQHKINQYNYERGNYLRCLHLYHLFDFRRFKKKKKKCKKAITKLPDKRAHLLISDVNGKVREEFVDYRDLERYSRIQKSKTSARTESYKLWYIDHLNYHGFAIVGFLHALRVLVCPFHTHVLVQRIDNTRNRLRIINYRFRVVNAPRCASQG